MIIFTHVCPYLIVKVDRFGIAMYYFITAVGTNNQIIFVTIINIYIIYAFANITVDTMIGTIIP